MSKTMSTSCLRVSSFASEMFEYVDADVEFDDDSVSRINFCDLKIVYEKMPNEESKRLMIL